MAAKTVKVIEIKTVGAYEVAILSTTNASALTDWLAAHQFGFPKEKQSVLDQYIQKHWFFVAARINPEGSGFALKSGAPKPATIPASTRKQLASGELHPVIISFPSEKCIFPLAISSVNGTPSELSLYVLSAAPLLNPVIFDRKLRAYKTQKDEEIKRHNDMKKSRGNSRAEIIRDSPVGARMRAEDPNDPPPPAAFDPPGPELGVPNTDWTEDSEDDFFNPAMQPLRCMQGNGATNALKACRTDLPRIKGKQWWLTKLIETFPPEEMVDLEFVAALPFLAEKIRHDAGEAAAYCLPQFGRLAVPIVLDKLNAPDLRVRRRGLMAAAQVSDARFEEPILKLLADADSETRIKACYAALKNWNLKFVEPLVRLVQDPDPQVFSAARYCLNERIYEINIDAATLGQMLARDGPASAFALQAMQARGQNLAQPELVHLLSYTNLATVSMAFSQLRDKLSLEDLNPLMTNSLPIARFMALGTLSRMADEPAVDRIVSMLHDPNEVIRWRVRSRLRRLTGQKLGADPAAYEKWWRENKDSYVPKPASSRR